MFDFRTIITNAWYKPQLSWYLYFLLPLELLYRAVIYLKLRFTKSESLPIPVIVVGNITVGGTGKTPLILWIFEHLQQQGLKAGIISRGYKGNPPCYPHLVSKNDNPYIAGDEPLMIARQNIPVVIDPNRPRAAKYLLDNFKLDAIISDDGLQHHHLARDLEICVIDAKRGLGNHHLLPCGPLRESANRLKKVDAVIYNNAHHQHFNMQIKAQYFVNIQTHQQISLADFTNKMQQQKINAIAGIGNPQRFFDTLQQLGLNIVPHVLEDHAVFTAATLNFTDDFPIIMTAKDAVKCSAFAKDNMWYLQVTAKPCANFISWFNQQITTFMKEKPYES